MRYKKIAIPCILYFVIVHSAYFWEGRLGLLGFPIILILMIAYISFAIVLLFQLVYYIKEKFNNRNRLSILLLLTSVLIITAIRPNGIVNFDKLSGEDLLIASSEGGGNCNTTLKLKNTHRFRQRTVCFGIIDIKGTYTIKNDTIYFKNVRIGGPEKEFFEFAVIKPSKFYENKHDIVRYLNSNDSIGNELWITKNKLDQLKQMPNH